MERKSPNAGNLSRRGTLFLYASALSLALLAAAAWVASSQASDARTTTHSGAGVPAVAAKSAVEAYGRLPLSFEANEGQADAGVKFISRGGGYALLLTGDGAVLALGKSSAGGAVAEASGEASRAVVRMKLVGANGRAEVEGLEELPGKSNYFVGNDPSKWRTNVPHYAKVKYTAVYEGVDLVYYGNQRQLEYDFVVAPGADPARVRMSFEGAESIEVDSAGELVLKVAGGEVRQRRPVVYQESGGARRAVAGRYVVGDDARSVGFEIGPYDPARTLVIDPVLVYSTYLSRSGDHFDIGYAIAVDSSGSAYVTGDAIGASNNDVFVAKLNPAGDALVYTTYLDGADNAADASRGIAVDSSGNAYISGETGSTDFPTVNPIQTDQTSGDAFVSKIATATFVVNSNGDADDNSCDAAHCSLREAINAANATPGLDRIEFNIPGLVVHTITPLTQLPDITGPVVIDGYTQPGATPNTLPVGSNAVLLVELSGAGGGAATGLLVRSSGSTIRGLVINRFPDRGINAEPGGGNTIEGCFIGTNAAGTAALANGGGILFGNSPNNRVGGTTNAARNVISGNSGHGVDIFLNSNNTAVEGNMIGTNAAGTAAVPNGGQAILIHDSANNTIGGTTPAARNVISGNAQYGIRTFTDHGVPAVGNQILGNFIGTDAAGTADVGNGLGGVSFDTSSNTVGGAVAGAGNVIAFNGVSGGISVFSDTGNTFFSNSIHSNDGLGIDLSPGGVTPNDAGDADAGANNLQNFPALSSATIVSGSATVAGTLDSTPGTTFRVEFFSNTSCDASGNGEGQRFLGSANVTTDASGNASVAAGPFPGVSAGEVVTATATDNATNDTSEFSPCVTAAAATTLTVTNTDDDGEGSLRHALNAVGDGGAIEFAPTLSGTVTLLSELVVNRRVTINGPGANLLTLSGNNERHLLNVQPGGVLNVFKLSFSNGKADGDGGAILNRGTLTLTVGSSRVDLQACKLEYSIVSPK